MTSRPSQIDRDRLQDQDCKDAVRSRQTPQNLSFLCPAHAQAWLSRCDRAPLLHGSKRMRLHPSQSSIRNRVLSDSAGMS